jgi:hypothetical protein
LTGNRVLLLLLFRGNPSVNRRRLHQTLHSTQTLRRGGARDREPKPHRPARACSPADGQKCIRGIRDGLVGGGHPCRRARLRKAPTARATISPIVRPLACA